MKCYGAVKNNEIELSELIREDIHNTLFEGKSKLEYCV